MDVLNFEQTILTRIIPNPIGNDPFRQGCSLSNIELLHLARNVEFPRGKLVILPVMPFVPIDCPPSHRRWALSHLEKLLPARDVQNFLWNWAKMRQKHGFHYGNGSKCWRCFLSVLETIYPGRDALL